MRKVALPFGQSYPGQIGRDGTARIEDSRRATTDHILPKLIHAKLIRTHTCATGSASCDYWYVGDESEPAKAYANMEMK